MNYREVIESRYNRQNWLELLHDIFGNKAEFWKTPYEISTNSDLSRQTFWLGTISLTDGETISVYEVELSDSVDIERNRRGIRDMLLSEWRNRDAGAFMFCYRKNESVLRFSYVSEAWTFAEDGSYTKESTDTKRFTYLLGEGHRSRTAIQQFEKLKNSPLKLKDLTKAFSVDAVSDMFFDGYKKQYADIIFFVTGKRMVKVANKWEERQEGEPNAFIMKQFAHFPNPEKAIRDYVKKLMGRIVFLQFLQKKGWLGVPVNAEWGEGDSEFIQNLFARCQDKNHFIDNVLEKLFEDLNSERTNDLVSSAVGSQIRVPYLNGGLFEREATDETEFPLPAKYMQSLLDFFASYNFTIDENDPDDAEVGVDPEMLGRIFENLLEDNKDKGAFYTPKEIVSYMCRESLIAYLQTDIEDETTKEAIRQFVTTHEIQEHLPDTIDQRLKDVKICDPAIGSGAFPMGLLKELFLCRTTLEGIEQSKAAEIKKHIIQQNIYGVDIERGAVDIARLRFWLSLIVDEETPQALPNLDYKIVEGNSLITTFDGQFIDLTTNISTARFRPSLVNIRREKKELQEEQRRFFTLSGEDKHRSEIAIKNHILNIIWYQLDFERHSWMEATVEQGGLFGGSCSRGRKKNKAQVVEFSQERKEVLYKCEVLMNQINDETKSLQERAGVSIPFFEWETIFSDIFDNEGKKGFDIVIGNPPYIRVQNIPHEQIDLYKSIFSTAWKRVDISTLFIEMMMGKLTSDGVLCYITSNQFLAAEYGRMMRKFFLDSTCVKRVVDFAGLPVFESAITYVSIFFLSNKDASSFDYYRVPQLPFIYPDSFKKCGYNDFSDEPWSFVFSKSKELLKKLQKYPPLSNIAYAKGGIITGNDNYFLFNSNEFPVETGVSLNLIRTDNIQRYYLGVPSLKVFYPCKYDVNGNTEIISLDELKQSYPQAYDYIRENEFALKARKDSRATMGDKQYWYQPVRFGTLRLFNGNKILGPGIVCHNKFTLDDQGYAFSFGNMYAIVTDDNNINLKVLLGILNSKLIEFYLHKVAPVKQGGYFSYGATVLEKIPLCYPEDTLKSRLLELVEETISTLRHDPSSDTSSIESEIDLLVYHLYALTYDEVKIVDPEVPITKEEYENQ